MHAESDIQGIIVNVTLNLAPAVESEIRRKAAAGGLTLEAYLLLLVEREAQPSADGPPSELASAGKDGPRPWRGVFTLPRPRRDLFSKASRLPVEEFPRREPSANMNWHRIRDNDE